MTDASEYENDIDELQENSVTHNSWIIHITRSFNLFKVSLFLYGQTACIMSFSTNSCLLLRFQICFGLSVSNFHCHTAKFVLDTTQKLLVFKQLVHQLLEY